MPAQRRVKVIDRGWNRLVKNLVRSPNVRSKVGVQGSEAEVARTGGLTNAGLAAVHEFGSPARGIPERSFLRSTFDEKQKGYQKELDRIAGMVLDGAALEGEMRLLGETYRSDIIGKIHSSIPPPLSPETIERKGGESTPLIDTGQLLNSISVVIEKGSR
jgi:hypothetical protein